MKKITLTLDTCTIAFKILFFKIRIKEAVWILSNKLYVSHCGQVSFVMTRESLGKSSCVLPISGLETSHLSNHSGHFTSLFGIKQIKKNRDEIVWCCRHKQSWLVLDSRALSGSLSSINRNAYVPLASPNHVNLLNSMYKPLHSSR